MKYNSKLVPKLPEIYKGFDNYSFEYFAQLEVYKKVNKELNDLVNTINIRSFADLGCGTGIISDIVLSNLKDKLTSTILYAVDHSASALKIAAQRLAKHKKVIIEYIAKPVQNIAVLLPQKVDAILYCNSIHYVENKSLLLSDIRKRLNEDGKLIVNTTFYNGGEPQDTQAFHRSWLLKSARILRREYGLSPQISNKVQTRKRLKIEDYKELLEKAGFKILKEKVKDFDIKITGMAAIAVYKDWIEGTLPGVPLKEGAEALLKGLDLMAKENPAPVLNRRWLYLMAEPA